jgi:hypothetical protein
MKCPKRSQYKYTKKAYRVRDWHAYEDGLRPRPCVAQADRESVGIGLSRRCVRHRERLPGDLRPGGWPPSPRAHRNADFTWSGQLRGSGMEDESGSIQTVITQAGPGSKGPPGRHTFPVNDGTPGARVWQNFCAFGCPRLPAKSVDQTGGSGQKPPGCGARSRAALPCSCNGPLSRL